MSRTPDQHKVPGRRRGKPLGPTRQALLDRVLPKIRITLAEDDRDVDPHDWFQGQRDTLKDIWLEIGFGKGEHLAWQAGQHPDIGFVGCEPYETGIASLIADLDAQNLSNVRVMTEDAAWLLSVVAPASLGRAYLLFPDPWPKARHHKRRFVTHAHLDLVAAALREGAEFRIATDHPDYGEWIVRHMSARDDFAWLAEGPDDWQRWPSPPEGDWPGTRYEAKALKRGAKPIYLRYRRVSRT